jgi:signal transduction histidine kinase
LDLKPNPDSSVSASHQDAERAQRMIQWLGDSLQVAVAYNQALLGAIPYGIVIMDLDAKIKLANVQAEQLFGLDKGGLVGQTLWSYLAIGVEEGGPLPAAADGEELQFVSTNGHQFFAQVSIHPVVIGEVVLQVVVIQDVDERVNQAREISRQRQEMKDFGAHLLDSQEEERRRIALDLHDDIGQRLAGLGIGIHQAFEETARPNQELAPILIHQIEEAAEAIRGLSLDLRPAVLDHAGLVEAVEALVDRLKVQVGLDVNLLFDGIQRGDRLDPEVEIAAYRIVQEALTNAFKYARVCEAHVLLALRGETLVVSIRDEGEGFERGRLQAGKTVGLSGMHERALQLGGQLSVISAPSEGTTILAELPLSRSEPNSKQQEEEQFRYEEDFDRR